MSPDKQITIPQCKPLASYQRLKGQIDEAIAGVLARGTYILGDQVAAFEQEFADYHGGGYAVGVANGTDALELAMRASGVSSGSQVFTVSHTAVATVAAVEKAGASPVLVDINSDTFTMSARSLDEAVTSPGNRRRGSSKGAVILVHLYGQACPDIEEILSVAKMHDLAVIEDCSQAHGAEWKGRKVGTFGHVAAYSLYPTKNLGALGDGGICLTNDAGIADRLRLLREYGWRQRYVSDIAGGNSRLDELQAAVLRVKLKHLDEDNASRRRIAGEYRAGISNPAVLLPSESPFAKHVCHQFAVRCANREGLKTHLARHNIGSLVHYPSPIHLQPAYHRRVKSSPHGLPQTELVAREVLSLPLFPELSDSEIKRIVGAINCWEGGG